MIPSSTFCVQSSPPPPGIHFILSDVLCCASSRRIFDTRSLCPPRLARRAAASAPSSYAIGFANVERERTTRTPYPRISKGNYEIVAVVALITRALWK